MKEILIVVKYEILENPLNVENNFDVEIVSTTKQEYVQYMRKVLKRDMEILSAEMKSKGLHKYDIQELSGAALMDFCEEKKVFIKGYGDDVKCYLIFNKEKVKFTNEDVKFDSSKTFSNFYNVDRYIESKKWDFEGGDVADFM